MEWDWNKMKHGMIDVTPFLLFESSADSDDSTTTFYDPHQEQDHEQEHEAMDDDAESCSYDHSYHVHGKSHDHHRYDEHVHDYDIDDYDEEDTDDDDTNWGESKMIGQEKRCHDLFVNSSILDDKQFWEACLAS